MVIFHDITFISGYLTCAQVGHLRSSSTTSTTNDRLQERLARAVAAKKYAVSRPESHASSSNVPSRVGSPITVADTPRRSTDNLIRSEDTAADKNKESLGDGILHSQANELEDIDI